MRSVSVVFLCVVGYLIVTDLIRDLASPREVSVYGIECKGQVSKHDCLGTLGRPLVRRSFVAFPDSQQVVEYEDGIITRLEGCTVFDWRTWNCTADGPDGSLTQVMDRGEFLAYFAPPGGPTGWQPGRVYVSAWQYYWHRFTRRP